MAARPIALSPAAGPAGRTRDWTPWVLLLPVLGLFLFFFAVPVLTLLASSLQRFDPGTGKTLDRLTLYNFHRFLFDRFYLGVLFTTLQMSLVVTLVCLLFGYPAAYYLSRSDGRERTFLTLLILSPLLVSLVIRSFGWLVILGPRGLINATLLGLGLLKSPLKLIYTQTAVVIGLAHVFFPFMVLSIASALQNIDPALFRAAHNLGATRFRTFWRVTLPLSLPGIMAGSLIVFALSASSFVTPTILGGPWVKVVAYLAYEQNVNVLDWPFGAAISVILLVVTAAVIIIYNRLVERGRFAAVFQ